MGRTRQTRKKPSPPISIRADQHYYVPCKQIISILRKGVEKHEIGRKHRQNIQICQSKIEPDNAMDTFDAAFDVIDDDSDWGEKQNMEEKNPMSYYYGRDLPQGNHPSNHSQLPQDDEVEPEVETPHLIFVDSRPDAPLDPSKIYVQKHPFARDRQPIPTSAPLAPSRPPYWPFKSLIDFEQAEECIDLGLSKQKIDRHMKLAMKTQGGPQAGPFTLKGAADMYETLDKAVIFDEDKFMETSVETKFRGQSYYHTLRHRSLDAMIRELLADPELEQFWTFDAERRYMANTDGSAMRVYEEYHHGDDMWDIQTAMGSRTHPILLSLYADATQLSSFGCGKLWTFYLTLANLPCHIRNSRGKGGPTLGGYLPEVNAPPGMPDAHLGEFRCLVYHDCWRVILSSIQSDARSGNIYQIGIGNRMHGTPLVAMKNTDYEEGCRMERCIGRTGPCGCLICGVPSDSFDDFDHDYLERDSQLATLAVEKSLGENPTGKGNQIPLPRSLGIRPIKSAFDGVTNRYFSNHRTIGVDDLHVFYSGVYGRTAVPDLLAWMHKPPYPKINKAFGSLPRYPDLKHFKNGWCALQWKSAEDWKLLTPVLDAVLSPKASRRCEVLRLFRLYGECTVLISFKTHTDATLEKMRSVLEKLAVLQKDLQVDLRLRLNTPKMHVLHNHLINSIRQKGPLANTSTSFGEACHPQSKEDYKITNKQTGVFENTMLKIALRRYTVQKIRDLVDLADEGESLQMTNPQRETSPSNIVKLGSPETTTTLGQFLQTLRIPEEFPQPEKEKLLRSMNACLYHNCQSYTEHGSAYLKVIPQKYGRIPYISLHNNDFLADKIRVTSNWYNKGPRYDFVVVNLDDESLSFAQVHAMLILTRNDEQHQIALIRLLKTTKQSGNARTGSALNTPKRNRSTGYIHASQSSDYRFVSTKCFIRSAFVHPPTRSCSQYIINDLIDQDM